jgi:RNA polymerase sigma-70 factor, ECF subfamily
MRESHTTPDSPTDIELLQAIRKGDSTALGELYDRHARLVYSLALRILKVTSDAEEVTQDTFFQIWRQADRIDPARGTTLAWLVTVARSRAIDKLRARKKLKGEVGDENVDRDTFNSLLLCNPRATAWDALQSQERADLVGRALSEIPDDQRQALELAYYEGLSQSEIAEHLKEPLGTIKTRVRLGMKKLRDILTAYGRKYEPGV